MSASIYKPVSPANGKGQTSPSLDVKSEMDTRCGFWICRPACMQSLANVGIFTALCSISGLMTQTLTHYVNSQVTTLERQFGFSSYQTGIIMAANDIGYLVCALFAGYMAPRTHIPRSLGIAVIIYGISGIACSLPHFLFGALVNKDPTTDITNSTESNFSKQSAVFGSLCDISSNSGDPCGIDPAQNAYRKSRATSDKAVEVSLIIIVIGMALQGFGKAPRASFAIVYVDDNTAKVNTGFLAGIMAATAMLGPVVAFLLGGVFSRMYVTLEATQLTPRHPKWIGAWWLGFIVFGLLSLVTAIPLFWFPRKLQRKKVKDIDVDEETITGRAEVENLANPGRLEQHRQTDSDLGSHRGNVHGSLTLKSVLKHVREFLASLYRLVTNPVYVCLIIFSCFLLFMIVGNFTFFPKYLERMFHLPAHTANYITGGLYLFTSSTGTFVGGVLSKRYKMTAMTSIKFIILTIIVALIFHFLLFIFQCEQPTVHMWPSEENSCNRGCNCRDNSYFPICGDDGRTYYSPCHAGCLQAEHGVYQNCSCITRGQAAAGVCDHDCPQLYGYVVAAGLRNFSFMLSLVAVMIVYMRCVPDKDKSMALSVYPFMTTLFGFLLAPIVFGKIIDKTCLLWDIKCLSRGRCLLYDNNQFRVQFHGYTALGFSGALVFAVIVYLYARWTRCLDVVASDDRAGPRPPGHDNSAADILILDPVFKQRSKEHSKEKNRT